MKNIVLYDCQANHGEKTLHCGAKVQILDKSKFKGINFSLTKGSSRSTQEQGRKTNNTRI